MDQGRVDPAFDGDGAHRDAMEAMHREQLFGGIEDDGSGFLATLDLGTAARAGR
jgi:hypothetical protein